MADSQARAKAMDEDQQWAVVMLAGAALEELKRGKTGRAREHLEDIQAVLLGGASYAVTLELAKPRASLSMAQDDQRGAGPRRDGSAIRQPAGDHGHSDTRGASCGPSLVVGC